MQYRYQLFSYVPESLWMDMYTDWIRGRWDFTATN